MKDLRPLFQGEVDALRVERDGRVIRHSSAETPPALLPGSFNPVHQGHWELAAVAERLLKGPVAFELSVINVDKPPLDGHPAQGFSGRYLLD